MTKAASSPGLAGGPLEDYPDETVLFAEAHSDENIALTIPNVAEARLAEVLSAHLLHRRKSRSQIGSLGAKGY
jgi:hypothetical protein